MPVVFYRDPNTGSFVPLTVPSAGGGTDEVWISDTEPTDPAIELWADLSDDTGTGGGAGGTAPNEVTVSSTQPTDGSELWMDLATPDQPTGPQDDADWTLATLILGWTDYGSGYPPARFRKYANGQVEVQGLVKGGTTGLLFMLPEGYRPTGHVMFSCIRGGAGGPDGEMAYGVKVSIDGSVEARRTTFADPFYSIYFTFSTL